MNILLISDVYFSRVNGVSTSVRTFTEQLQKQGHVVHLIAPDYGVKTEDDAWISRVPARRIFFDPEDYLMKYSEVIKLLPKLKENKFDLIHIHTPFVAHYAGLRLAKALEIPLVETYHTFFEDYLHHYLPWIPKSIARSLARRISRKQCNQVDAIVAPSKPMLDVLRSYGVTAEAEVIATGLQDKSFAEADGNLFRKKYGITINRPMMLYVGRVAYEKNIDFLLEVTQRVIQKKPDVLMVITGEGPAEKCLHAKAHALGIENSVQFIGYLDRNTELNACYQSADVFVFASKSETQGLVLLEAMAQATPVVAIAELGTASILVEGQGARIAVDDVVDFAEKVHSVITQPKVRNQLGKAGRAYALSVWTASAKAQAMVDFYQHLIAKKQSSKSETSMQVQSQT